MISQISKETFPKIGMKILKYYQPYKIIFLVILLAYYWLHVVARYLVS